MPYGYRGVQAVGGIRPPSTMARPQGPKRLFGGDYFMQSAPNAAQMGFAARTGNLGMMTTTSRLAPINVRGQRQGGMAMNPATLKAFYKTRDEMQAREAEYEQRLIEEADEASSLGDHARYDQIMDELERIRDSRRTYRVFMPDPYKLRTGDRLV